MDDLISRQKAIEELLSLNDQCNSVYYTKCIDDAVYALEILPSAQPDIIRCKDCKWASYDCEWCLNPDAPVGGDECARLYIEPDWFCADGKRKENKSDG